jgi:hypothetical protein
MPPRRYFIIKGLCSLSLNIPRTAPKDVATTSATDSIVNKLHSGGSAVDIWANGRAGRTLRSLVIQLSCAAAHFVVVRALFYGA